MEKDLRQFPTIKENWIHSKAPSVVLPGVWIAIVFHLGELHGSSTLGIPIFLASFLGVPLLMTWIMRLGEYNAVESLIKGLEHANRKGNHGYGEKRFNEEAKQFILSWWRNNSKSYLY
jgi:hypothetical protein